MWASCGGSMDVSLNSHGVLLIHPLTVLWLPGGPRSDTAICGWPRWEDSSVMLESITRQIWTVHPSIDRPKLTMQLQTNRSEYAHHMGSNPSFFFFCFFLFFFLSLVSENWEEDVGYVQEEPLYLNNKDEDEMWPPNNLRECRQNIPWLSILNRSKKFTLVDTQELKRNRRICHSFVLLIKFKLVLLIEFRLIYVFEFEFEFLNRVF